MSPTTHMQVTGGMEGWREGGSGERERREAMREGKRMLKEGGKE